MSRATLLILGGAMEARGLADAAVARFGDALDVETSLAGRTRQPRKPAGRVRVGGFGGAAGLAAYLEARAVDLLIDATHPFARRMPWNALAAAKTAGVPRLRVERPPWSPGPQDRWIEADDAADALAKAAACGRRLFVTLGAQEAARFAGRPDLEVTVRLIETDGAPAERPGFRLIAARGPFEPAAEEALLTHLGAEVLVTKNSGGAATAGKLAAARALGLPVVMIRRPPPVPPPRVETPAAALDWLASRLAERF
ncbi:MAG: cobalt-precorrin-6A reductase [Marivibrio sp.]|uniref:cobalt-precorrin-6A reductase n=1 Tax=Marivibrio sp. TaxID=2039719 RepID=UPI0032EF95D5